MKNEKVNKFIQKGITVAKESIVPACIFGLCMGSYLFGFEWGVKTAKKADEEGLKRFNDGNNTFYIKAPKENETATSFMERLSNETERFLEKTNDDNISMDGVEANFIENIKK